MSNFPEPRVIVEDQHTVSDTALALSDFTSISEANVKAAKRLWLIVNSNAVRLYYGGTTPTITDGIRISAGNDFVLFGNEQIGKLEIIRDGGTDAEVVAVLEG